MKRLFCLVGLTAVVVSGSLAQSASGHPRFEVASVKPSPPEVQVASMNGGPMPAGPFNQSGRDPGRITWSNIRLLRMIQVAYDFPMDRISGPEWLGKLGYDISATVPVGASVDDFRKMLQSLLAERFKLTVHRGTKDVSGYALEVAKNGAKLVKSRDAAAIAAALGDEKKPSAKHDEAVQAMASRTQSFNALVMIDENGFGAPRPGNPYYSSGAGFEVTIAVNGWYRSTKLNATAPEIATFLGGLAGAPAEDHTGLSGTYDVHVEYVPRPAGGPGDAPTGVASEPGPDVLDAIQAQLGLKLTPRKVPVETLVIDHAEKVPTEN